MWNPHEVNEYIKISEMFSLFEAYFDKNYVFRGESHNFWECVYVIDGKICISGDENVYNMKKSDIIFHQPLEMHKFHISSPEGAHLFIFSFSLDGCSDFFKKKVFSLNGEQDNIIHLLLEFLRRTNPGDGHYYIKYMEKFKTSPTYSQEVVSYIYQLMLSLCHESTLSFTHKTGDAKIFYEAVNYMNANIAASLGLEEIAGICGTSLSRLKNIFSKYAGLGIHKYFLSLKINAALKMLEEGTGVTEVSEKLGFSSQGYFSLAFKRETGYSPSEYRNLPR